MADLKFADTHNLVVFLSKPAKSEGFEQIVDFLNANPIRYALTINPTIYISCIEQFWSTVKAKTINGEVQLHALVDGKKIIITESTVRRDLQLEDAEDEVVYKELDDSLVRAATTASSLEAEQDSGGGPRRQETIGILLLKLVLDLEKTKTTQAEEIVSLKRRVKKLEQKKRSRTLGLKRLYKVGLTAMVESFGDEESLDDAGMFDVNTLTGDEVLAEQEVATKDVNLTMDEVTLAQALDALKSVKHKVKANVVEEPSIPVSASNTKILTTITSKSSEQRQRNYGRTANIALIETWDDIHAKIDVDHQLAERMHATRTRRVIYMLVEKKYPLAPLTLSMMLEKKLMIDYETGFSAAHVCVNAAQLDLVLLMNFKENMLRLPSCSLTHVEGGVRGGDGFGVMWGVNESKDEAPEEIKTFLKKITVLLQALVIIVRTDNNTEFKNQVLQEYFNGVGISHQASSVRTPQQNGVVEQRNLMLALCYPKNDREDIGKLGAKGDIGFFISYSANSCAYIVYNRRTKKIMEIMNVTFVELLVMAFEQSSLKPRLQSMTFRQTTMYDDHIGGQPSATPRTILAAQAPQVLQTSTATTTIADTGPTPTNSSSQATSIPSTS
ncbi:retrovirus-related pol polyprotein from transposon TNT 1-94 [Tanacetum coccineum]